MTASSDSGVVGDHKTNVTTPTIIGTGAEPDSIVTLYDTNGTTVLGSTTADRLGGYAIGSSTLGDGTHALTVRATDLAGNASGASTTFSFTIDTTPPAAPGVGHLAAASDSGAVGDGITNVVAPTIVGSGTEAGSTVRLYDTDGTTLIGTGTADSSGGYSIVASTLAAGTHMITAKATDAAGNLSASSPAMNLRIDTAAPTATRPELAAASDSGVAGDGITNVTTPTITGAGAGAGSTVRIYDTDGTTLVGTGIADGSGSYGIATLALSAGAHSLTAKVTNLSGNTSVSSPSLNLTIMPPPGAVPTAPTLAAASDSGVLGDGITNVLAPTVTGSGATAGGTVRIYDADGITLVGTGVADAGGRYSIATSTLSEGPHVLTATTTDAAGNTSIRSPALNLTIDTTPPAVTGSPALALASDSGAVGDGITNVAAPTLTGVATASSKVTLYDSDGTTVVGTGTADVLGVYRIAASTLAEGGHAITARASDAAGNVGMASTPLSLTIDATAPTTTVTGLHLSNDTGTDGDFVTTTAGQTMSGTLSAPLGSGERLFGSADGGATWSDVTAMVSGSSLTWAGITLVGSSSLQMKVADAAGNVGPTTTQPFVLESIPVVIPPVVVTPPVVTPPVITPPVVPPPVVTTPVVIPPVVVPPMVVPPVVVPPVVDVPPVVITPPVVVTPPAAAPPPDVAPPVVDAPTVVTPPIIAPPATVTPTDATQDTPTIAPTQPQPQQVNTNTTSAPTSQFPAPAVVNTVYRFFDSTHGTQFLTSNVAERDSIMATRPDLTFEGKAMGSVGADPSNQNVASVYRFFDGSNGTHFFTTSSGERDQILATRHDMVLEQANMYEHVTQQAGDVAVYRFFATQDGSHFFTSNAGEIASIAQNRPDMVAEGISFYAPKV